MTSSLENYKDLDELSQGDATFTEPLQDFDPLGIIRSAIDLTLKSDIS